MEDHRSFRDGILIIEGVIRAAEVVVGIVRLFLAGGACFASQQVGMGRNIFESEPPKNGVGRLFSLSTAIKIRFLIPQ